MNKGLLLVCVLGLAMAGPPAEASFNFQDFLQNAMKYSSGFLYGFSHIVEADNAAYCVQNINNITVMIEKIRNTNWDQGDFWSTTKNVLERAIETLNITIQEWTYCYDVYRLSYQYYSIFYWYYDHYWYYYLDDLAYNVLHFSFWYVHDIKQLYLNIQHGSRDYDVGRDIAQIAFRVLFNSSYWKYKDSY